MNKTLEGKVAIVTGASRGVGAEAARQLASEGAAVCVNYHKSADLAEKVAAGIRSEGGHAIAVRADVTSEQDTAAMVEQVLEEWGRADIIVNNALPSYRFDPAAAYTSIETVEWGHFQGQIDGAIRGCVNMTRAALPAMKSQGFGKIINISTNLVYNPVVTYYDYTTAKAGLVGLTRNMAAELGKHGIRVNLLAGGLLSVTDASSSTTDEVFGYIAGVTPLRKVISVADFAASVVMLASPWSDAITGQSIAVDGGLTMA
jgi:3-oxoacyl-[acyl-carrier protein] reductase